MFPLGYLGIKLFAKSQQNIGHASEAPISKHQIPNNIQIPVSNDRNGFVSEFGHLVIGNYFEFGIWILRFQYLFWFRLCRVTVLMAIKILPFPQKNTVLTP
jgi:hypothetical protein